MPQPTQQTPSSPLPVLNVQVGSGLNFPWEEYHKGVAGTAETILGADGVTQGMVIWMNWRDVVGLPPTVPTPLGQLLGYCKRAIVQTVLGPSGNIYGIKRVLPWKSPYWDQYYVKRISSVRGVQMGGRVFTFSPNFVFGSRNPSIDFKLGLVALEFWRPPYYVLPDEEVPRDANTGYPQEWTRYLDKRWEMSTQILARQGQRFVWLDTSDVGAPQSGMPAAPGMPLVKLHLKRRWYEIPEESIFSKLTDGTPNGIPTNLLYTQTAVVNPVTCFAPVGAAPFAWPVNPPPGAQYVYPAGSPLVGTVNATTAAIGGVTSSELYDSDGTFQFPALNLIPYNRFLGFPMGTLLYLGADVVPRPLQLPPWMMEIPYINPTEPIAQVQYDVSLNFLYFNPPTNQNRTDGGVKEPWRGHNLMPFSGTGWSKMMRSQINNTGAVGASAVGPYRTALDYSNFVDLFKTL